MIKRFLIFIILFPCVAFADTVLTNNVIGGCDTTQLPTANDETKLTPVFEPIEYTCPSGQFLPADTTGCRSCPNGYNCNGGEYAFSETNAQGLSNKNILTQNTSNICAVNILFSVNNTTRLTPVFEPMNIICSEGYYLGADDIECTQCPANSYCGGGTYTFNETTDQGITPCPNTHPVSSAGSSSINQCKKQINWYSTDNILSTSTMCNYDGLINLPETPTRPGYVFNGWKLAPNQ